MRIAVPSIDPAALAGVDPAASVVRFGGETMGTTWRVSVAAPAGFDLHAMHRKVEGRLAGLVDEMSHWAPDSVLSRFNRAAAGTWLSLPPDFATVMAAALEIAALCDGAFDPTLGLLVDLSGHGPPGPMPPPDTAALEEARRVSGWRRLDYDPAGRRLRQPGGLRLDLSGIAKGYAVDAIADTLAGAGLRHALVEIGGELAGRGIRPDGDPWWVDLEAPVRGMMPIRVALHELSVATSGDYVRGVHTIDPATGRPAESGVRAVSVFHRSTMIADAWASALSVLCPPDALAIADHHDLAVRIVHVSGEHVSAALVGMLGD